MRDYFKLLFLISFIPHILFSADLNSTIVDGNATIYQGLLKNLDTDKNLTEEMSLEKTLLHKLLTLKEHNIYVPKKLAAAKNMDDYRNLFFYYLDDIEKITAFSEELRDSQKKAKNIASEIKKMAQHDKRLLSYQLQEAFYSKKVTFYQAAITDIKKEAEQLKELIAHSLQKISFDRRKLEQEFSQEQKTVLAYEEKLNKLHIEKEQAELVNDHTGIAKTDKELSKETPAYSDEARALLSSQFLLFSVQVKEKSDQAFVSEKALQTMSLKYNILTEEQIDTYLTPLLLLLEKRYIGQISTFADSGEQEVKEVLHDMWQVINEPIFSINNTSISIFKIVLSLLIFTFGFVIGAFYKRKINHLAINYRSVTPSTRIIIANIGYYIIVIIAFFIALNALGIRLSSLAMVAGALSVGIGFGLQNIVSNLVSGIILMFERSIKVGDYVEVDNHRGYVTDIRMRATTINTNENIDIIIPNQAFIQDNMINWTMSDQVRRFSIPFSVAYGTDVHKVIEVVREAILESEYREHIVENKVQWTRVIMTEMAESSVNFELLVWVKGEKVRMPNRTKSEFLVIIYDTLYTHEIKIPFPQRDLHIRSVDEEVSFVIGKENNTDMG